MSRRVYKTFRVGRYSYGVILPKGWVKGAEYVKIIPLSEDVAVIVKVRGEDKKVSEYIERRKKELLALLPGKENFRKRGEL